MARNEKIAGLVDELVIAARHSSRQRRAVIIWKLMRELNVTHGNLSAAEIEAENLRNKDTPHYRGGYVSYNRW